VTAALALAVALVLALLALIVAALWSLRGDVAGLRVDIEQLRRASATPDDVRAAVAASVAEANAPATDDAASVSRVPQRLRTRPIIKAMAFGSGSAHVARRLRGTSTNGGEAADGQRRNGH
jgi:hypothetical protein